MKTTLDWLGRDVLVIAAHPDDSEISMGGTIMKLVQEGCNVTVAIHALSTPTEDRKREAEIGANLMGARLHILSEASRQTADVPMKEIVQELDQLLELVQPDAVFTHYQGDTHLDHRILTEAVLSATRRRPFHLLHFEQSALLPVSLKPFHPNFYVDISAHAHTKWDAISVHYSQTNVTRALNEYQIRARYHGAVMNTSYAEAFLISRLYG